LIAVDRGPDVVRRDHGDLMTAFTAAQSQLWQDRLDGGLKQTTIGKMLCVS
jgi:hypothetical protein